MTENKKIGVGIAGISHMHVYSYINCIKQIQNAELVAIADENVENKIAINNFGIQTHNSYEKLAKNHEVDAVLITTETLYHKNAAIQAFENGKHVIVEKPIATTIEDAKEIIAASKKAGRMLIQCYPCRYHPTVSFAKSQLDGGTFGKLTAISGTNHGMMPAHEGSTKWFTVKELSGGGALMDHITHLADLYFWFTKSELKSVYAVKNNLFHPEVDIDDAGMVSLEFQNGIKASIDPSWSRPNNFETWGDLTMTLYGTEKTLFLDMFKQAIRIHSNKLTHPNLMNYGSDMDFLMLWDFISCIQKDQTPMLTGEDGLRALEVAILAYESAEKGKKISK